MRRTHGRDDSASRPAGGQKKSHRVPFDAQRGEAATSHKPIINLGRPSFPTGAGRVGWVGVPMSVSARAKVAKVISPYGPLTLADLSSPKTQRWSIRRKAEVLAAVRGGLQLVEEPASR